MHVEAEDLLSTFGGLLGGLLPSRLEENVNSPVRVRMLLWSFEGKKPPVLPSG